MIKKIIDEGVFMLSLLRQPDAAYGATENSDFRFEENLTNDVKYEYVVENKSAKVIIYPNKSHVKYLKLRFRGDLSNVDRVFGDQWERAGIGAYLEWRSVMPSRALPNFCYIINDGVTQCYGVKTGANCFALFNVDTDGITLFLNLCCGNEGVTVNSPFTACEVVEFFGSKNEDCFSVAAAFAKKICDNPVLPSHPVFGLNNWYWAYGNISKETVIKETKLLMRLTKGCKNKPYMIIDDGWQLNRENPQDTKCIGGAWVPNSRFKDIEKLVEFIHSKGAKAGIWFRPLLTTEDVPEEAVLTKNYGGTVLDPSHPYTLQKVENDTKKIRSWGFDLIKFDFTTTDATGRICLTADDGGCNFLTCSDEIKYFDKSKTTAMILKNLYKTIWQSAGGAEIIGCQTISHLTAGIIPIYRIGNDTSGTSFEWTKRHGLNSIMRLPLNNAFYKADPDCAAFTEKVDFDANLDFLDLCARTGMTTLASVKPDLLTDEQIEKINKVFLLADKNDGELKIKNFKKTSCPDTFISSDGKEIRYKWNKPHDGSRIVLSWDN